MANKRQPVSISTIVEGATCDSRLYRDILLWLQRNNYVPYAEAFNIQTLGTWLVKNNKDLQQELASQTLRTSLRVHKKRSYITSCVQTMVTMGLIDDIGETTASKNSLDMQLYCITSFGKVVAQFMAAFDSKGEASEGVWIGALGAMEEYFLATGAPFQALVAGSLRDGLGPGVFLVSEALASVTATLLLDYQPVELLFGIVRGNAVINSAFMKRFQDLDEKTRDVVLFDIKLRIENELALRPTKEWKYQRAEKMGSGREVVLQAFCEACRANYPHIVNTADLLDIRCPLRKEDGGTTTPLKADCKDCGAKGKLAPAFATYSYWGQVLGFPLDMHPAKHQ